MRKISYEITKEYDTKTVEQFLRGEAKVSLSLIRSLKHYDEGITLNGIHTRTIDKLKQGDILSITLPEEKNAAASCEGEIEVIFEDEDILAVNKPPLVPIHESHNHQGDTLQNLVASHLIKQGKSSAFHAIGRLDKGTSGIVVCALNRYSASILSGKIKKEYLAVTKGVYTQNGTIDAPIFRPDERKTLRVVDERGDRAVTHFEVLGHNDFLSVVRCKLETGRTHQIRVHFSHKGTALYGDTMYGEVEKDIAHQCLHCEKVSFVHPLTREEINLWAKMPPEMEKIVNKILMKE